MDYRRVIPCLDVKDGRLVKGVHFVELKEEMQVDPDASRRVAIVIPSKA